MQKKLIALAVAAAFSAPAFADVNVYGLVDAAVVRATADGQKTDIQAVSGGLASSRIGVKSAEDLNNGMKAVVVLEYGLDTETGSGLTGAAARQQILAIAGDFGTFATGYAQTTGYDWGSKFDPAAGSAVSPLSAVTKGTFLIGDAAVAARAQRALAYISPDMGGVTVAVNYSTALAGYGNLGQATTTTGPKVSASLVSATYTGVQNLAVGVVVANVMDSSYAAKNDREYAVGASYDLGVVKLFGTYQANKVADAADTTKAMSFSAVAPVGPGAVAFSYAKSSNLKDTTGASANAKGMTVAWLQGLSKTTTFYAAYEKVDQDSGASGYSVLNGALAPAAGKGSNVIAVGLNKKF